MSWSIGAQNPNPRPRRKLIDDANKQAACWQHTPAAGWSDGSSQETWSQLECSDDPQERPKKRLNSGSGSCSTLASQGSLPSSSRTDESAASHTSEPPSICRDSTVLEASHEPTLHETPVYHKNTRMPVDGWFQPCRYECRLSHIRSL